MPDQFSVGSVLAVALATGVVVSLITWFVGRRRFTMLERRLADQERQLTLHGQSISGLTAGALGLDKRLGRVEAEERALSHRQETFENQQIPDRPYHHAIKLVQQGAGASRLVEELDLSRSEAELIVRLHGAPGG